jgi:hypothetical protein
MRAVEAGVRRVVPLVLAALALRARAVRAGVGVIDIPAFGQQTNDYDEVGAHVAGAATDELEYLGLALHGPRRAVSRVTGTLRLLGRSSPSASRAA